MSALTRLGDRAIGREPEIRPRRLTPFEASRPADRPGLAAGTDDPSERARARARVGLPDGPPEASTSGAEPTVAIGTPPHGVAPRPRVTAQLERSPAPAPPAEATRSTPAFAAPANVTGEPPPAPSPAAAGDPYPATPALDPRWVPAAADALPDEPPMSPGRSLPIPAAIPRTPAARRERPGLDAGRAASRAVQVTIGRVDVRAVYEPPATRATPPARRPGAMPLEQYLKERGRR
ncbi:MAG: hypothetical protein H6Q01_533 [Acidobacteria bacterium]|nr:hypothetical protein [Acidobacteriota bacterium]